MTRHEPELLFARLTIQYSLKYQIMQRSSAIAILESLSSGIRLDVFRLLVEAGPDGLVAGEIGLALKVSASNLSFHLKALTHAQLVSVQQSGRFQRYRANMRLMNDLISYLTAECCSGQPEQCVRAPFAKVTG